MVRFAPLIAPVMHQINVYTHYFFVPNRLTWDGWEQFITGGELGAADRPWPHLSIDFGTVATGSLHDYLGLPTSVDVGSGGATTELVSALPYAAYQLIWDEYYRDENLQATSFTPLVDGLNTNLYSTLRNRAWSKDYFTSALPWTQKGPEAMLPLGTQAPIVAKLPNPSQTQTVNLSTGGVLASGSLNSVSGNLSDLTNDLYIDLNDTHYTDLSQASASSIIELRRAFRLQEWLEKNARGGSRYTESMLVHFGVKSSDARLQRPEYLGGFKSPVSISEVLQTSASNSDVQSFDTPQGNMAGHGISVGGGKPISHYAEEHGYIIGIQSVLPQPAYQQGIPKHFLRQDKFDYFWPEFQHIGEQAILQKELLIGGNNVGNDETFGYTPRYAEYKFINSTVHGDYKSSLEFWHLGRKFAEGPLLNSDFIEMDNDEIKRIFAVEDDTIDNLWCHVFNSISAKRKMAVYGSPKM